MTPFQRLAPPLVLGLLAPLIAEYLLGDLTLQQVDAFPVLALMYGAGAVLIREAVRRSGRSWPTFVLLALAYGLVEEGLATQSLFNPNYMGLHLLDYGAIPALGTAAPWAIYGLSLHVIWSLAVPIGLAESLFVGRRSQPWLSRTGIVLTIALFVAGVLLFANYSWRATPFRASQAQLAWTGLTVLLLGAAAFGPRFRGRPRQPKSASPAFVKAGVTLSLGSILLSAYAYGPSVLHWPWQATTAVLVIVDALLVAAAWRFALAGWRAVDAWAASLGGSLAYAWYGYVVDRTFHGEGEIVGHSVIVALVLGLQAWAGLRVLGREARPS
jgi:hypothetical protein